MNIKRRYTVELTAGALQDLDDIVGCVAAHDAPAKAQTLLERLLDAADTRAPPRNAAACPVSCRPWACANTGRRCSSPTG